MASDYPWLVVDLLGLRWRTFVHEGEHPSGSSSFLTRVITRPVGRGESSGSVRASSAGSAGLSGAFVVQAGSSAALVARRNKTSIYAVAEAVSTQTRNTQTRNNTQTRGTQTRGGEVAV